MTAQLVSADDGFAFSILRRPAQGPRRGGVILLQEIFGLDYYIQTDAERWSAAGFEVIAPSLFDRQQPGFVAAHDAAGVADGFRLMRATEQAHALGDVAACVAALASQGRVNIVGYCYGGRIAWEAAALVPGLSAASCYYGQIAPLAGLRPLCPTICHFGRHDANIDAETNRAAINAVHPDIAVHIYERSGHGFNNHGAPGADEGDAALARARTLELFLTA